VKASLAPPYWVSTAGESQRCAARPRCASFRPEFITSTSLLEREQIARIVDVPLARLERRMADQDLALELTSATLENRLAEAILANQLLPGDTAVIDFGDGGWKLEPRRASEAVGAN
jgi:hypothetical protein